ncbi:MAG: IS1 family transposase [Clostridium sp.]|nr:IS1 family transposase [Clostridium sp.]
MEKVRALSKRDRENLLILLKDYLVFGPCEIQTNEDGKRVCHHCGGTKVVKNGTNKGIQRFLCRDCQRTFTNLTHSATYGSKHSLDVWLKYADCMLAGGTVRESAKAAKISVATASSWRHKILDCIAELISAGLIKGISK